MQNRRLINAIYKHIQSYQHQHLSALEFVPESSDDTEALRDEIEELVGDNFNGVIIVNAQGNIEVLSEQDKFCRAITTKYTEINNPTPWALSASSSSSNWQPKPSPSAPLQPAPPVRLLPLATRQNNPSESSASNSDSFDSTWATLRLLLGQQPVNANTQKYANETRQIEKERQEISKKKEALEKEKEKLLKQEKAYVEDLLSKANTSLNAWKRGLDDQKKDQEEQKKRHATIPDLVTSSQSMQKKP